MNEQRQGGQNMIFPFVMMIATSKNGLEKDASE
jgi:hypothetical protein